MPAYLNLRTNPFYFTPGFAVSAAFFGIGAKSPLSIVAKSTIPWMNWKRMISAANPRKRMSRNELPFTSLPLAARAGATETSVTINTLIRVLMPSSF